MLKTLNMCNTGGLFTTWLSVVTKPAVTYYCGISPFSTLVIVFKFARFLIILL